jgi:hypothetical protein
MSPRRRSQILPEVIRDFQHFVARSRNGLVGSAEKRFSSLGRKSTRSGTGLNGARADVFVSYSESIFYPETEGRVVLQHYGRACGRID